MIGVVEASPVPSVQTSPRSISISIVSSDSSTWIPMLLASKDRARSQESVINPKVEIGCNRRGSGDL